METISNLAANDFELPDGDIFTVEVDLHHFLEREINVKVVDDSILIIEARHEERGDSETESGGGGGGPVSRHFLHRYRLPKDVAPGSITSQLSATGVLTLTAKRLGEIKI